MTRWPAWVTVGAALATATVGTLVLIDWTFIGSLREPSALPRPAPGTAFAFILLGLALFTASRPQGAAHPARLSSRAREMITLAAASAFGLMGLIRLIGHGFGWGSSLDTLWVGDVPALMSPATSAGFALLGAALVLAQRRALPGLFQACALLAALFAWFGLSRYVYGGEPLTGLAQMSIYTALLTLLASAGVLCLRPNIGLVGLLTADDQAGALTRRILPAGVILPLVIGYVRLKGYEAGLYDAEAGLALSAIGLVIVFSALVWATAAQLHRTEAARLAAERKTEAQLERLSLLHQITRAMAERQDLRSIFQVALRHVEDSLPIDFGCVCLYDQTENVLQVLCVGVKSEPVAMDLAMTANAAIPIDKNGLSRCVRGEVVYEPDIADVAFPFPQRLVKGGLRSLVVAPLLVESHVFGVFVAARRDPSSFSSGEVEFVRHLSEHVAMAAHQARLYNALQQSYDDLRQTQQAVMQQERLRALGQMASGIAHDINNALSPVALYTESLLESDPTLSPKARSYLEIIQHAIDDVAQTITRMREFYRQRESALTLFPVDVNRVVQQVVELTRARWSGMPQQRGAVIDVRLELAPEQPIIMAVESELKDALVNLVFNAVDAMPDGGALTLRTVTVPAPAPAPHVVIEVQDSGMGMDEETRRRCMEPFYTTKGDRGTGLGLAMVYGAIRRHSADIEIDSAPGAGTTMRMRFALPAAVVDDGSPADAPARPNRLRVLVIDDDPLLTKSLQDTLEADGHSVTCASGGQAGINAFRGVHGTDKTFGLVITDLGMPYVDGREVARAIKTTSATTPIILLTGWGQRLNAEGDIPQHVDRVLNKPPRLRELRAAFVHLTGSSRGT